MFKFLKNWWSKNQEEGYERNVRLLLIDYINYSQTNAFSTVPHDILQVLKQRTEELEKFWFRPETVNDFQDIFMSRNKYWDVKLNKYYYGFREQQFNLGYIRIFRRDKKEYMIIPDTFLMTEKEKHQREFDKQMDKILKDD